MDPADAVSPPLLGVVEGFYGRAWSWQDRRDFASFLQSLGLNTYLYAPKSDPILRKQWRDDWSREDARKLAELAGECRRRGLHWGVGLSPFELYRAYDGEARKALKAKVRRIDLLGGNVLAVLFDDMPGDCPDLAERQAEIIADVMAWTSAERLLACPTYYSHDPVLERHFGAMPGRYWEDLGNGVDPAVGLFWTGDSVCSARISAEDLEEITGLLRRKPVLWDNYPVNDGAAACRFLHLTPLPGRDPGLPAAVNGHLCNPMNQARLSRYPLTGLATLYDGSAPPIEAIYDSKLANLLSRDRELFETAGLDAMDEATRATLASEYDAVDDPAAAEVAAWLRDEYSFDPACLTG